MAAFRENPIRLIAQLIALAFVGVQAIGFTWNAWFTPKSQTQGPQANPTPGQQVTQAVGDIGAGAGGVAKGAGGLAESIGQNATLYLIGGLAIFLLIGGRR